MPNGILVCDKCFTVIHSKSDIAKHNACCLGELGEIDEHLCDAMLELWKMGIQTFWCCQGHHYDDHFSRPYVVMTKAVMPFAIELKKDEKYKMIKLRRNYYKSNELLIEIPLIRAYHSPYHILELMLIFVRFINNLVVLIKNADTSKLNNPTQIKYKYKGTYANICFKCWGDDTQWVIYDFKDFPTQDAYKKWSPIKVFTEDNKLYIVRKNSTKIYNHGEQITKEATYDLHFSIIEGLCFAKKSRVRHRNRAFRKKNALIRREIEC